jgi:hypothetical protein
MTMKPRFFTWAEHAFTGEYSTRHQRINHELSHKSYLPAGQQFSTEAYAYLAVMIPFPPVHQMGCDSHCTTREFAIPRVNLCLA